MAEFLGPNDEVGWDGNGQLLFLRYKKGGDILRRFEYTYDDAGNRISQLDVKGVGTTKATKWEYGYDWLDRLETVKKAEAATVGALGALQLVSVYTYDAADNRTEFVVPNLNPALTETFRYSFDNADSITMTEKKVGTGSFATIETFTSDDDGNLKTRTAGGVTTTYNWDDFNRLAAISTSDNSKKQSHTFGVNGFRRKKKDKNNVETTEYAAGLATAVSKVEAAETITYLMGHQIMGLERSTDGAMFYFLTDALSTVRDVVRGTDGAVMASYEFDEYGRRLATSESGVSSQKTFVGGMSVQDEVAETGLMMMGHRFYAPDLGRFLNRDPIGFAGGLNLFEYAGSSPTHFTDSRGLQQSLEESDARQNIYSGAIAETFSLEMFQKWAFSQIEAIGTIDVRGQVFDQAWSYLKEQLGFGPSSKSESSSIGPQASDDNNTEWISLLVVAALKSKAALQAARKRAKDAGRCLPELDYLGTRVHGIRWSQADAFTRAMRENKAQGRFTMKSLKFADEMAQTLSPGDMGSFPLPPGVTGDVFLPDGSTILEADYIWVWRKVSGNWHGYPRVGPAL